MGVYTGIDIIMSYHRPRTPIHQTRPKVQPAPFHPAVPARDAAAPNGGGGVFCDVIVMHSGRLIYGIVCRIPSAAKCCHLPCIDCRVCDLFTSIYTVLIAGCCISSVIFVCWFLMCGQWFCALTFWWLYFRNLIYVSLSCGLWIVNAFVDYILLNGLFPLGLPRTRETFNFEQVSY